ncbi:hypothetical protein HPG69_004542 [Diceros bicornis minor]|uniref:SCAN box domain-containing protein n=1 Tax=Diceros bicornis minor TaxID=77932 RepID=A0A7J7F9I3_DICBM|nr:hypothetical protein HPG69_004542 [Diceros bicornis minor]
METEGYPDTQRNREVQNDQIRPQPNEIMAEEPEVVLIGPPQVQVSQEPSGLSPESLNEESVEDLETMPRRNAPNPAVSRQRFRKFRYEDAAGPRDVLRHLQELAGQWLRPDIHTKEQIVEMLVQEQFQAVLPEELRARAQRCQPGSEFKLDKTEKGVKQGHQRVKFNIGKGVSNPERVIVSPVLWFVQNILKGSRTPGVKEFPGLHQFLSCFDDLEFSLQALDLIIEKILHFLKNRRKGPGPWTSVMMSTKWKREAEQQEGLQKRRVPLSGSRGDPAHCCQRPGGGAEVSAGLEAPRGSGSAVVPSPPRRLRPPCVRGDTPPRGSWGTWERGARGVAGSRGAVGEGAGPGSVGAEGRGSAGQARGAGPPGGARPGSGRRPEGAGGPGCHRAAAEGRGHTHPGRRAPLPPAGPAGPEAAGGRRAEAPRAGPRSRRRAPGAGVPAAGSRAGSALRPGPDFLLRRAPPRTFCGGRGRGAGGERGGQVAAGDGAAG